MMRISRSWYLALAALTAACSESAAPVSPEPLLPTGPVAALACTANVAKGVLTCGAPASGSGGPRLSVIGGQDLNVKLTSTNVSYDGVQGVLSADITVQNLLDRAMGGDVPTRVFFHRAPVAISGSGDVSVRNADGEDTFTEGAQPYFAYAEPLQPGETSAPRRWEWSVPASVGEFAFTLLVDAPLSDASPASGLAFRSIAAHGQNVCGVTLGAQGYCWGHTAFGAIGAGDDILWMGVTYRPIRVQNGPWDVISVGDHGACGLKEGEAWCWGTDLDGGLGTGFARSGCGGTSDSNSGWSTVPVKVVGEFTLRQPSGGPEIVFTQIAAGGNVSRSFGSDFSRFTCGVDAQGAAYCWGSNYLGTLGDGRRTSIPAPVRVLGDRVYRFVTAGYRHACALDEAGKAYCWGKGVSGELGHGPPPGDGVSPVPTAVQGGHTFRQIAAGAAHTCGVTTAGEVWCWGSNGYGNLGTDDPVGTCNGFLCSVTPVRVESGLSFVEVTSGQFHSCARTAEGEVWCWGREWQVGRGSSVAGSTPCASNPQINCLYTPVRVQSSERFVQVAAARESTCAIARATRKVYCWGSDSYTLAQGVGQPVYVPTRIVEPSA
jgi:alpha-tubulin suppressor-like RCC1 family protein